MLPALEVAPQDLPNPPSLMRSLHQIQGLLGWEEKVCLWLLGSRPGQLPVSKIPHTCFPRNWGIPKGLGNREQKTFRTTSTDDTYPGTFSIHTPFLTPATFSLHTEVPAKVEAHSGGQVAPVPPSQIKTRQLGHVSALTSSKVAPGLLAPRLGTARTLW